MLAEKPNEEAETSSPSSENVSFFIAAPLILAFSVYFCPKWDKG